MKKNYCGNYGCKNCQFHRIYASNSYYEPDEHECDIPDWVEPDFELSDEELDDAIDRVWSDGEEWDKYEEQICPYYREYIEPLY